MIIFGGDGSVSQLATAAARLTILTGDSGVGKTTVLTAAQEVSRGETVIAPALVAVRRAPGALQRALLESLALAVAEISLDETAAERVGAALKHAIDRILDGNIKGLAAAVGRHLLGIVRARVGDAAVDALGRIAAECVFRPIPTGHSR